MISAILLAAGSSRRMGAVNKLLLPWKGTTLVAATTSRLLAAAPGEVIVVTGHQASDITKELQTLPVQFINNPSFETGLTSSIRTGIGIASGDGFMICLADMAFITPEEYGLLSTAFQNRLLVDERCIILPEFNDTIGNPVIFSAAYRPDILHHPEKEGCKSIVRSNKDHHLRVTMPTDHILRDIDYPDDYKALNAMAP